MSIISDAFFQHVAQTSLEPLGVEIASSGGSYVFGPNGERYLDFISGIAVSNVGHSAPEVVQAVQQQAALFMHTMVYGEHIQPPQAKYAQALAAALGPGFERIYFTNSGSEAVEGALKVAKKFTGRSQIFACKNAYHGSTHGALSATDSWIKEGYGPFLSNINHIEYNNFDDILLITTDTAAVIIEPIQGEAGVILPRRDYLQAVRRRCTETGTLLICDEIQTGFGRTGSLFAFQRYGIQPDIITLGKALGGGMPLGAFAARHEVMHVLSHNPVLGHITTFGGHPVCCAAGLAAFTKIQQEELVVQVARKERLLLETLVHPAIRDLRGTGLMYIAVLDSFPQTLAAMHACLRRGLLTDWFLNMDHGLRIYPPLTISEAELVEGCRIIQAALTEVG